MLNNPIWFSHCTIRLGLFRMRCDASTVRVFEAHDNVFVCTCSTLIHTFDPVSCTHRVSLSLVYFLKQLFSHWFIYGHEIEWNKCLSIDNVDKYFMNNFSFVRFFYFEIFPVRWRFLLLLFKHFPQNTWNAINLQCSWVHFESHRNQCKIRRSNHTDTEHREWWIQNNFRTEYKLASVGDLVSICCACRDAISYVTWIYNWFASNLSRTPAHRNLWLTFWINAHNFWRSKWVRACVCVNAAKTGSNIRFFSSSQFKLYAAVLA